MSTDNNFWNEGVATDPIDASPPDPQTPPDPNKTTEGAADPAEPTDPTPPSPTELFKEFRKDGQTGSTGGNSIIDPNEPEPLDQGQPADPPKGKEPQGAPSGEPGTDGASGSGDGDPGRYSPEEVAFTRDLAKDFQEYGILGKDVKPEEVQDYDDLMRKLQTEKEAEVDSKFKEFMQQLVSEDAEYFQFRKNGGTLQEFVKLYSDDPSTTFEISTESGQESFVRNLLKTEQNMSDAEIDVQVEFLKTHDKLQEYSTKAFERVKGQKELKRQQSIAAMEESRRKEREQIVQNINKAKQLKEIGGIKFTDREAAALANFAYNPSEQTQDGRYTPGVYAKLREWQNNNPELFMLVAELVKSDMKSLSTIKVADELKKKAAKANALAHVGKRPNPAPAGGGAHPPANVTKEGTSLWENFIE